MIGVRRLWGAENVFPLVGVDIYRVPPGFNTRSLCVLDNARDGKIIDVPGRLVVREPFQEIVRDPSRHKIMA
jgi:hypothetical protein